MKKILFLMVVLLLVAAGTVGVVSCGSSSSTASSGTTTTSSMQTTASGTNAEVVTQITIKNFAFTPASVSIPAGTKMTWVNNDSITHTVTSDTGAFDSQSITPGSTYSFTFTQPGTYKYHCSIHSTMTGTVIVQ